LRLLELMTKMRNEVEDGARKQMLMKSSIFEQLAQTAFLPEVERAVYRK